MKKRRFGLFIKLAVFLGCGIGVCIATLLFQGRLPLRTLACNGRIDRMRYSPDGRTLAAVVHRQGILLWDTRRWALIRVLPGSFESLYFTPDSRSLLTFDLHGGPGAEAVNQGEGLTKAQWEQFKNDIQGRLQRWDISSGQAVMTTILPAGSMNSAAPAANMVAISHNVAPFGVSIRDMQDGHEDHFIPGKISWQPVLSPNGRWLAIVAYMAKGNNLTLWNTRTWQKKPLALAAGVESTAFSPDSRWFGAAASPTVNIWSVGDWHLQSRLTTGYDRTNIVGFTLDSKLIIADGGTYRWRGGKPPVYSLTIGDAATGCRTAVLEQQEVGGWKATSRGILTHDMSDHGKSVLWNPYNGRRIWEGMPWPDAAVSPDGRTLLTSQTISSRPEKGISRPEKGIIEVRHLPGY